MKKQFLILAVMGMAIGKITPGFNVILCLQKFVILNLIQELKEAETSSA